MITVFEHIDTISTKLRSNIAVQQCEHSITYEELNYLSNNVKNNLVVDYSIKKADVVGVSLPKCINTIAIIVGILKAGAVIVFVDEEQPQERQNYIKENSSCKYLVCSTSHYNSSSLQVININPKALLDKYGGVNNLIRVTASDDAYIVYTSGTTGLPKGALINHAGLENMAYQQSVGFEMSSKDKLAHFASYSFDAAIAEIFETLVSGATLVIPQSDSIKSSPSKMRDFLVTNGVSILTLTPSFLYNLQPEHLDSLRMVLIVGERLETNLVERFIKYIDVFNSYGVSECSICTTIYKFPKDFDGRVKIGKPIANSEVLILNESYQEVPQGEIGEIFIGGIGVAKGYVKNSSETAKRFILLDKYSSIFYKTGDLGSKDIDGQIIFHGRKDEQIKIKGIRIEPKEIEVIASDLSFVINSHVAVVEYNANKQLVLFIETDDKTIEKTAILEFLKKKIPNYMLPNRVVFVNSFPITIGGKLDKRKLHSFFYENKESLDVGNQSRKHLAILSIFQDLLGVKNIKIDKNIFNEYGCDSLLALNIIVEIEERLGIEIATTLLYKYPTVESFIQYGIEQNLDNEIVLDKYRLGERYKKLVANSVKGPRNNKYLVTGGTSKLGLDIIKTLLEDKHSTVYCLLRNNSLEQAKKRMNGCLQEYENIAIRDYHRIIPVVGDVTVPRLGLSADDYSVITKSVDIVYHLAAEVNHFKSFDELEKTNVTPIQYLVEICSRVKRKKLIFISSCAVFLTAKLPYNNVFSESSKIEFSKLKKSTGYSISKFCAEHVLESMKDMGFDYQIHRLDILLEVSRKRASHQWIDILVNVCLKSKLAFYEDNLKFSVAPHNTSTIANAVVFLSKNSSSNVFHVFPSERVSLSIFLRNQLSEFTDIKFLSYEEWYLKVSNDTEMLTPQVKLLLGILNDIKLAAQAIDIDSTFTNQLLKSTNLQLSSLI